MEQFNSEQFNADNLVETVPTTAVEFDGYSLVSLCGNSVWTVIKTGNVLDLSGIAVGEWVSSVIDGGGTFSKRYWNRTLTLRLFVQWSSHADLLSRLDALKSLTRRPNSDFTVLFGDEFRTREATVTRVSVPPVSVNDDFADDIEMDLLVTSGFWTAKVTTTTQYLGKTGDFEAVVLNVGGYEAYPKVFVGCANSGNAITGISVSVKRLGQVAGETVSIVENVGDWDLVIFDFVEKTVTVNGAEVPYFGPMVAMDTGYSVLDFEFAGTVNADVTIAHNKTYL